MKIFLLLALTIFAGTTQAQEKVLITSEGREYLVTHAEEKSVGETAWQVDGFRERPGRWQRKIFEREFANRKAARRFIEQYVKLHPSISGADDLVSPVAVNEAPGQVLWVVTNQWSWDWEVRYADWFHKTVDTGFFYNHNIATDCADVAVASRWIFARINGLPVGNTLAGSGQLFTQDSMLADWVNLPRADEWDQDQLFMAALRYILENTYTETLLSDSYPVQINASVFSTGVHHLEFYDNGEGHTMLVNNFQSAPSLSLLLEQSTVPAEVRFLTTTEFVRSKQPPKDRGGFMRIRWLVQQGGQWNLLAGPQHPGYSEEEYDPQFLKGSPGFSAAVKSHLSWRYDEFQDFQGALAQFGMMMQARVQIVIDGYNNCQKISCAPGTEGWENWSTPARDGRMGDILKLINTMMSDNSNDRRYQQAWDTFGQTTLQIQDQTVTLASLADAVENGRLDSDPRDSIEKRWGLTP